MADQPMTASEFCAIQAALGLTSREMARALGMKEISAIGAIARIRSGDRPPSIRMTELMRLWMAPDFPPALRPQPGAPRPALLDHVWTAPPPGLAAALALQEADFA